MSTARSWENILQPSLVQQIDKMSRASKMRFARRLCEKKCGEILAQLVKQAGPLHQVVVETAQVVAVGEQGRVVSSVAIANSRLDVHVSVTVFLNDKNKIV